MFSSQFQPIIKNRPKTEVSVVIQIMKEFVTGKTSIEVSVTDFLIKSNAKLFSFFKC